MQVAELQTLLRMPVPMQVDIQAAARAFNDRLLRRVDKALKLAPGLLGVCVARRGFNDFAVAVHFSATDAADDDVWPMATARVQLFPNGPRQLLRVRIKGKRALLAIGKLFGLFTPAVRRGQDERQVARQVLDVAIAAEVALAWLIVLGGAERDGQ